MFVTTTIIVLLFSYLAIRNANNTLQEEAEIALNAVVEIQMALNAALPNLKAVTVNEVKRATPEPPKEIVDKTALSLGRDNGDGFDIFDPSNHLSPLGILPKLRALDLTHVRKFVSKEDFAELCEARTYDSRDKARAIRKAQYYGDIEQLRHITNVPVLSDTQKWFKMAMNLAKPVGSNPDLVEATWKAVEGRIEMQIFQDFWKATGDFDYVGARVYEILGEEAESQKITFRAEDVEIFYCDEFKGSTGILKSDKRHKDPNNFRTRDGYDNSIGIWM